MDLIFSILRMIALIIQCIALGGVSSAGNGYEREVDFMAGNAMSYAEMAEVLEEVGIQVPDGLVQEMETCYQDIPEDVYFNKGAVLLSGIGMGDYNYDTWEWTPGSEQVYCFDMEAFDISCMYGNLMQGIEAIGGGELTFTDVREEFDYEQESGTRDVIFKLNGQEYTYEAELESDWYDLYILDYFNDIFKQQGLEKRLYFMSDGYQCCIIFYADEAWAAEFRSKTGYALSDNVRDFAAW